MTSMGKATGHEEFDRKPIRFALLPNLINFGLYLAYFLITRQLCKKQDTE
jgi:hypothetical protein